MAFGEERLPGRPAAARMIVRKGWQVGKIVEKSWSSCEKSHLFCCLCTAYSLTSSFFEGKVKHVAPAAPRVCPVEGLRLHRPDIGRNGWMWKFRRQTKSSR
jgi:hypothetical protein